MDSVHSKILIVDDHLEFAEMMAQILRLEGLAASLASDGESALRKIRTDVPDLILLDLGLPDMNGKDVMTKAKAIDGDIAVIVITGYGGERVAIEMMKAGAFDFISKPFEKEVLLGSIRNALTLRQAQLDDKRNEGYSSLEKFFPFLAHEIRNPLHAISGALTIIQRRIDLRDEILAQSTRIIQEEVRHLTEFVQECLNFVRPPSQGRYADVDIREVTSVIANIIRHMFEEASDRVRIHVEIEPGLPRIKANYEEIKQAFLNIARNGFEAMDRGGELRIQARLLTAGNPGCVEIRFIDTGAGIQREHLSSVFDPFFTTKTAGTGLGLAICRRIVERHRGQIWVESEWGRGTTVAVKLPLSPAGEPGGIRE
jgi:two-component system, sensor histidine kinase and response regulator